MVLFCMLSTAIIMGMSSEWLGAHSAVQPYYPLDLPLLSHSSRSIGIGGAEGRGEEGHQDRREGEGYQVQLFSGALQNSPGLVEGPCPDLSPIENTVGS